MGGAALIWDPQLTAYDMGDEHPLDPVRLTHTVKLIDALGILAPEDVLPPRSATDDELHLVHASGYVEAVRLASSWSMGAGGGMGLGTPDNPVFPGMHDAAALIVGSAIVGLEEVLAGRRSRTFAVAGGLHHAHHARAAGFCVYNDPAVAIAVARRARPGLRMLYVDIDAHHGDGVQEAFEDSPDVMTISLHETGMYAFPGTGFSNDIGHGAGTGFSANVPLPAYATDACYELAFEQVVAPLVRAFRPDAIVAQLGVDAHHTDPLTSLGLTIPGYRTLVRGIIGLADEVCEGRLAAVGGGGYNLVDVVPLAWAWVMAELAGVAVEDAVPETWRAYVRSACGCEAPASMGAQDRLESPDGRDERVLALTRDAIAATRAAVFPHHGLEP